MSLETRVSKLESIGDPGKIAEYNMFIIPDEQELYNEFQNYLADHPGLETYCLIVERSGDRTINKKRILVLNNLN